MFDDLGSGVKVFCPPGELRVEDGERHRGSDRDDSVFEVVLISKMRRAGKQAPHESPEFIQRIRCQKDETVWTARSDAPSVCGWYAVDISSRPPRRRCSSRQNLDTNLGSRSETMA